MIDFDAIAAAALSNAESLLREWFPAGRREGHEYKIGNLNGDKGKSLSVNMNTGLWADFATGEKGADLIGLLARHRGCKKSEAARELAERLRMKISNGKDADESTPCRLTIEQYAKAKGFEPGFLEKHGVEQNDRGLLFRFLRSDGKPASRHQLRFALTGRRRFIWTGPTGCGGLLPYGLETLLPPRSARLHVVEGPTDRLTGLLHKLDILALPGASTTRLLKREMVTPFDQIVAVIEPDSGGETLRQKLPEHLRAIAYEGALDIVRMPRECKDLNELHRKWLGDPGGFEADLHELIEHAERLFGPPELTLRCAAGIESEDVRWLWHQRNPYAKVTVITGDPGDGKSMLTIDIAAHLSSGIPFTVQPARWEIPSSCPPRMAKRTRSNRGSKRLARIVRE